MHARLWRVPRCVAGLATAASALGEGGSAPLTPGKLVLGCGSNVVDHIYRVKVVPKAGAKGFFSSPYRALEKRLIGGVTLNHLSWAALGGVPTGLLALQGNDELGRLIRNNLRHLGVSTDYIATDSSYSTAQCHVFIQDGGERSIVMAPAATSLINSEVVKQTFDTSIQQFASMVTTEISQVPLDGVRELLTSAKKAGILSVLDLDIPPSVAEQEAGLGSVEEVIECVKMADVLKPAKAAADELVDLMTGSLANYSESVGSVAECLVRLCGSKLVAMTNGAEDSVLANSSHVVCVAPPPVSVVMDTTGAGDAFLGGLIVGITRHGGLPTDPEGLMELGKTANAFGAACTQSIGGVPTDLSRERVCEYLPGLDILPASSSRGEMMTGFHSSLTSDLAAALSLCDGIDEDSARSFMAALTACGGTILTSGIGKSGAVAARLAGSLSSVGVPSHFVHAAEWMHGDLGKAEAGRDVVVFLSHGGGTMECVEAARHLVHRGVATLAITSKPDSELGRLALASLTYPAEFAEPFQIMPTSTLVIQEMLCNGLVCELIKKRGVTKKTFLSNHPGGSIGQK